MQIITVELKIHISYMMLHSLMKLVHLDSVSAAACTGHSKIYPKAATPLGSTTFSTQHSGRAAFRYCMSQVRGKAVPAHTKMTYGKIELQLHSFGTLALNGF
jgi:hypothetical protein